MPLPCLHMLPTPAVTGSRLVGFDGQASAYSGGGWRQYVQVRPAAEGRPALPAADFTPAAEFGAAARACARAARRGRGF